MKLFKRREFLKRSVLFGGGFSLFNVKMKPGWARPLPKLEVPEHPVVIASANGERAVSGTMALLNAGSDPLDAVIAGVNILEDDPDEISVGYGGLPNEDGVVQLDASVMHGPLHNAGAVAALEGIKNPSKVAKLVMERTDHVLLVGKGAQDFAASHGFKIENLLTDKARKIWLYWKETNNERDDWFPPKDEELDEEVKKYFKLQGTINCCALNANGDLAGVTTTSGLAFKIPGRVGDSPIIGAGLYVDNDVGAAGSTGRGEANLKNLCCFNIVEHMRRGLSPTDASLTICERIVRHTRSPFLFDDRNQPRFNVTFYAVNKSGETGGASIQSGKKMWVYDKNGSRLQNLAHLI